MKLVIFGATGRTGKLLTKLALAEENKVIAYVRHPQKLKSRPGLTIVVGQLTELTKIATTIQGCDAIAVTLGPRLTDPKPTLMQKALSIIIRAAQKAQVKRIVVLSAAGVGQTAANVRWTYKLAAKTFLKKVFCDHAIGEDHLVNSGLDWTTVHPGVLINGRRTAEPRVFLANTRHKLPCLGLTSRYDVAALILTALEQDNLIRQRILVTSAQKKKGVTQDTTLL